MRPKSDEFLRERGIGPVEERIRLAGSLPATGGRELPAELCLTATGTWVVAAAGPFVGRAEQVGDAGSMRYEPGGLRDRLLLGDTTLSVPTGRATAARRLIALGRVRRARPQPIAFDASVSTDRYLEEVSDPARELVCRTLDGKDVLIAWCKLSEGKTQSALGATVPETIYLVLSADHALLLKLSELGDSRLTELQADRLSLSSGETPGVLTDGVTSVPLGHRNQTLLLELPELARLSSAERLHEVARRLWLAMPAKSKVGRAPNLLRAARRRGHSISGLIELALLIEQGQPLASSAELRGNLAELREDQISGETLASAFERWQLSSEIGRQLVTALSVLGNDAEPWALALRRSSHRLALQTKLSEEQASLWDAELGEHELTVGDSRSARSIAQNRLQSLSLDEDAVLRPERTSFVHSERVRLLEIRRRSAELEGGVDVGALAALAKLEPTSPARLLALARANSVDAEERRLIARAQDVLRCFSPGGLDGPPPEPPSDWPAALDRATLDQYVRHPLARGSGRLATRLSELVASVPEPDLSFLRDFCEALAESRYPEANRALLRATHLLGLRQVAAYVSHGARSIGILAFGASPPFILIGESHLRSDGPYVLRGAELDFALGAELAHLAFDHQRVTSGEVWAGAAGKTREALVVLGLLIPLLGEIGGPRAQKLLGRVSREALERAAEGASRLPQIFGQSYGSGTSALGKRNEELIAAHRLVQLTADRAGLVAAGELRAALRAVLLTRSDYREALSAAAESGLLTALLARQNQGAAFADLLLRVRALVGFYLSQDFDVLANGRENDSV